MEQDGDFSPQGFWFSRSGLEQGICTSDLSLSDAVSGQFWNPQEKRYFGCSGS